MWKRLLKTVKTRLGRWLADEIREEIVRRAQPPEPSQPLLRLPDHAPESIPPEEDAQTLPAVVEAAVVARWSGFPVAARMSRTYARQAIRSDMPPEYVARMIRENGEEIA